MNYDDSNTLIATNKYLTDTLKLFNHEIYNKIYTSLSNF